MKYKLTVIIALVLCLQGLAQKPVDSLALNKREWISNFLPAQWGRLSYGSFQLEPEVFLKMLDQFKQAAYDSVAGEPNAGKLALKKKDIDAYARVCIQNYAENYGVDSAKDAKWLDLIRGPKEGDEPVSEQAMEEAQKARFVKQLPEAKRAVLDSMVFNGWDIRDSALFRNSLAFRQLVDLKLLRLLLQKYKVEQDGLGQVMLNYQKMLDEVVGQGYVYEFLTYDNLETAINRSVDTPTIASLYKHYMAIAKNKEDRKNMSETYTNSITYVTNAPAPDFSYKDINGKTITLKSLRGKYVYIDVWATWCGPCKAEIPYLVKLEEALHGKKIHFVSISVDKQKDKGAWEKYVKEKNLKGIQLMVDKDIKSDFIRKLNINFIPRFILIGPDGKIVDADAMRPSDKMLKEKLQALL